MTRFSHMVTAYPRDSQKVESCFEAKLAFIRRYSLTCAGRFRSQEAQWQSIEVGLAKSSEKPNGDGKREIGGKENLLGGVLLPWAGV